MRIVEEPGRISTNVSFCGPNGASATKAAAAPAASNSNIITAAKVLPQPEPRLRPIVLLRLAMLLPNSSRVE